MAAPQLPIDACVISLARTPERLLGFRERLGALATDIRWHPGVDGVTLDLEDLLAQGVLDESALSWPRGQIGCALSHLSAWQACVEKGQPLLIFEDDVQVAPNWDVQLNHLLKELDKNELHILLLGCNQDSCLQLEWSRGHRLTALFRPRYCDATELTTALSEARRSAPFRLITALGLAAYVITPHGASALLEWVYPLRTLPIQTPELPARNCFSLDGQLNSRYEAISAFIAFPLVAIGENSQNDSLTRV